MSNWKIARRNRVASVLFFCALVTIALWLMVVCVSMALREQAWAEACLRLFRAICQANGIVLTIGTTALAVIGAALAIGGNALASSRTQSNHYYLSCAVTVVGLVMIGLIAIMLNFSDVVKTLGAFECNVELAAAADCNAQAKKAAITNLTGLATWLGASLAALMLIKPSDLMVTGGDDA